MPSLLETQPSTIKTSWSAVTAMVFAGLIAAMQLGKAHIALPFLRHDLALDLRQGGWLISALNVTGLFGATAVGVSAGRFGTRRLLLVGLAIIALSSAAGAAAPTAAVLMFARLVEGVGFVMVVVAAPSIIAAITHPAQHKLAFSLWAAYVPGGVAIATWLAPPLLNRAGWRGLWIANAALPMLIAGVSAALLRRQLVTPSLSLAGRVDIVADLRSVLAYRGPVLLALIFGAYTAQHLGLMGFMPSLLMESGWTAEQAGSACGAAMAINILGNLSSGWLIQRGYRPTTLIIVTSCAMAMLTAAILLLGLQPPCRVALAFAFSGLGGIVPATVMTVAAEQAPSARLVPVVNGLVVQGSNLGIVFGPPLLAHVVHAYSWRMASSVLLGAASLAIFCALSLRQEARQQVLV